MIISLNTLNLSKKKEKKLERLKQLSKAGEERARKLEEKKDKTRKNKIFTKRKEKGICFWFEKLFSKGFRKRIIRGRD